MFRLLEESGFSRVRSAVVPRFRFRKAATQDAGGGLWSEGGIDDRAQARGPLSFLRRSSPSGALAEGGCGAGVLR